MKRQPRITKLKPGELKPFQFDPALLAVVRQVQVQNAAIIKQNELILRVLATPAFFVTSNTK